MAEQPVDPQDPSRREFIRGGLRGAALFGLGGFAGALWARRGQERPLWQIDPYKCVQCGKCATHCVLKPYSAVKCFHAYKLCGYCRICWGFLDGNYFSIDSAAENQLCPTGAIRRYHVENENHGYDIDQAKCIGCGKCVKGCAAQGNGSLILQIHRELCVNCNECAIAAACPAQAIALYPPNQPCLYKGIVLQ